VHAYEQARAFVPWAAAATLASLLAAYGLGTWALRVHFEFSSAQLLQLSKLLLWFLWPAWPLALWTLWRWRRHLLNRHIAVPLGIAAVALVACVVMGGSDRALMLGLPAMAVLAAFALPTLKRGASAVIDWFSVCFFTAVAIAAWLIYAAMQLGVPPRIAANVARLAPGFVAVLSVPELLLALLGSLAWLWLVRWRTGRSQHALWKSLVLPAGGVGLSWLLLMTLWLPLLDYARSYQPWAERIARHVPAGACIAASGLSRASVAALEYYGHWRVDARAGAPAAGCAVLLVFEPRINGGAPARTGWDFVARERRPTERDESTLIYRRSIKP
jgi:hypothetical protein